jgi:hypothetical protein
MTATLTRFFALAAGDRRLVTEAAARLALARFELRVRPATARRRLRDGSRSQPSADHPPDPRVDRILWAVESVARRSKSTTCLIQALAADAMLRRRGFASRIRVGVKPRQVGTDALEAHAWIECDGGAARVGAPGDPAVYARLSSANDALVRSIAALVTRTGNPAVPWGELRTTPAEFLETCAEHDLLGLVHRRIAEWPATGGWPPALVEEMARQARGLAAAELLRRNETMKMLAVLTARGVQPILIKGTALAYGTYDAPHQRPRSDTDLFIPREAVDVVRDALSEHGYQTTTSSGGERLFCQFEISRRDDFGIDHAFDFHWKISTQPVFAEVLAYSEVAAGAVALPRLGPDARGPGLVHALLLGCIHPVMHHRDEERPVWIHDIHLLVSQLSGARLDSFARLAADKGVAAVCAHGLTLARLWFGTEIPDHLIDELASAGDREPSAEYLRPRRTWLDELRSSLRGLPRWRDRSQLLREILFPHPRYMMASYGLSTTARSSTLLPVLYVHRAANGVWKLLTRRK